MVHHIYLIIIKNKQIINNIIQQTDLSKVNLFKM